MRKRNQGILLESGTNELEMLEFRVGEHHFGINVAKVRELIQYQPVQKMPRSQPYVEGVFKPRDEVFTVVDLAGYLGLEPSGDLERDIFIIAGFNQIKVAFHVHRVESIHRISWEAIEKPSESIFGGSEGVITGIAKVDNRLISIVDFEKIIYDINPDSSIGAKASKVASDRPSNTAPILIAEDSMVLRKMLLESLLKAGYLNVTVTDNGREAWERLLSLKEKPGGAKENISLVITDIEMPQMDGHHLCKRIKSDPELSKTPVVIFSSLITDDMRHKGEDVGADAQLSKPDIVHLVEVVDDLVAGRRAAKN